VKMYDATRLKSVDEQRVVLACPVCRTGPLELCPVEANYAELCCPQCGRHVSWIGRAKAIDQAQAYTLRSGRYRGNAMGVLPSRYLRWLARTEAVSHRMRKRAELVLLALRDRSSSDCSRVPLATHDLCNRVATSLCDLACSPDASGTAPGSSPNASATAMGCSGAAKAENATAGLTGVQEAKLAKGGMAVFPHLDQSVGTIHMLPVRKGGGPWTA
jgi:hypothetical protein